MTMKNGISTVCAMALLCSFGCGRGDIPELAPVTGTVTLDGVPFPNAIVYFHTQKEKGGRPAAGTTDAEGKYELVYLEGVRGAHIGMNKVEIVTEWPDGEPGEGESEKIPEKYNTKSTLTAEVKDERNVFDFNLESETPKN
ncbi:MAG: hypothetical protein KDB01_22545 [Planctomycetaceae bacterium]|nr:hypothetical protein [Planctomycetaceae bacterium]